MLAKFEKESAGISLWGGELHVSDYLRECCPVLAAGERLGD